MALFKTNKLMPAAVVLGFLFYGISVGAGFAAEPEEELRQLRQELREHRKYTETLEKRIDQLESKLAAKAATEKDRGFELKDIYDNGFTLRSKDNRFSLTLNGFGQFRYTLLVPETTGTRSQNFDVALARLALSGVVFDPRLSYLMQMQGSTLKNTNGVTMLDWWLKYGFAPEFNLQAGRFLLPYSRQYYTHPGNLLFPDLSEADIAFNLPRGIGAQVTGKTGPLSYYVALLNSIRALDASGQQNFNNKLGGLARLEFDILDPYGYLETSPKPVSAPQFSAGLAVAFNPVNEVSAFQHVFPGENTTNVTLDAGFRWQGLTFQGAGYYRVHNTRDIHDWGYYAQAGYYLVPERLEIAGRISGVHFAQQIFKCTSIPIPIPFPPFFFFDRFCSSLDPFRNTTAYSVGLNYYVYGHNLKIQSDYSLLRHELFFGPRQWDHRLRLQAQFMF